MGGDERWNGGWLQGALGVVAIVLAVMLAFGIAQLLEKELAAAPTVDLTEPKPIFRHIYRVCDKETGHLLYIDTWAYRGGVVVVPGGCK